MVSGQVHKVVFIVSVYRILRHFRERFSFMLDETQIV